MKRDDPAKGSKHKTVKAGHHHKKESLDLPETYGETRVVLLPVNPTKVHAFWDLASGAAKDSGRKEGQAVLRLHEAGGAPASSGQKESSVEVPVGSHAKSKYVNLQQSGKSYQAEIGYSTKGGQFVQAAQSNVAETPRPLPAPEKTMPQQPPAGPMQQQPAPWVAPQPVWDRPHENATHRPPAGTAPPSFGALPPADWASAPPREQHPPAPSYQAKPTPHGIAKPSSERGIGREGESSRSTTESEALLIKRRTAIFRHLSEAVPLSKELSLSKEERKFAAGQPGQPGPAGLPRKKDLTEISEQKFVAGISS